MDMLIALTYLLTHLTYMLLLHYLGETSQLRINNFGNQSYRLPLHKIKKKFIDTAGLQLSLKWSNRSLSSTKA